MYGLQIIENKKLFLFVFQLSVHEFFYIIFNFSMFIIYKLELNFFEQYKVHEFDWPWKQNKEEFIKLIKRAVSVILTNQLIVLPLLSYLAIYVKDGIKIRLDIETFPSSFEIFWQISFFMILEDLLFYWSHRFLHWDPIYPYIHKVHHEFKNTVSIASEHAHVLEFIFGNIIPFKVGSLLLDRRTHAVTDGLWMIVRILKTTEAHSGYQFPWSPIALLPLKVPSEFHNYHHAKFKGNYGSFFQFWDRLCGSIHPGYDKYHDKLKYN